MIMYYGHNLSCDETLVGGVESTFTNCSMSIESKANDVKLKMQDLIAYAAADPSVPISIDSAAVDSALDEVDLTTSEAISKLRSIINSISDYSDGSWSDQNNKRFLDNFLGIYPTPTSPSGSDRHSSSGNNDFNSPPTINNEEVSNDESLTTNTPSLDDEMNSNTGAVDIITEEIGETENFSIPTAGVTTEVSKEQSDIPLSNINGESSISDELNDSSSSIGKFSTFSIPSPSLGKIDNVNKSGTLGVAGIASASAAAAVIGGKTYYDKKREEKKNLIDGSIDDDKQEDENNQKEKKDKKSEFELEKNVVEFKNRILSLEEDKK